MADGNRGRGVTVEKLMFSVAEAAEILGIGQTKTYELVLTGQLGSVKVGRCRRVPRLELENYIARLIQEQRGAA